MSSNPFKNLGFLGEFIHTLDPQQRVAIPSVWRQCVPEGAFLAIPGSDNDVLLFPPDYLTCLMENARKDPFNAETHMTLKKFGVKPEAAIVVGDTVFDVQMGKNAGTLACGVTYGNGSRESLADAEWVIDDFGELLKILI